MNAFPPPGNATPGFGPAPSAMPAPATRGRQKAGRSKRASAPEGAKPTKRVVGRFRIFTIILVLVAGGLVAFAVSQPAPKTYVVRTNVAIGALQAVTGKQLEAALIDPNAVEEGAFSAKDGKDALAKAEKAIEGKRLQYPLGKGQQVRPDQFSFESSADVNLAPDQRLMSISAVAATSVSGNLKAGDQVDIVAVSTSSGNVSASLVKSDVKIISVSLSGDELSSISASQSDPKSENYDKSVGELVPATPIPGTYVISVSTADMLRFAAIDGDPNTQMYLFYRGADATDAGELLPTYIEEALGLANAGGQVTPAPANK